MVFGVGCGVCVLGFVGVCWWFLVGVVEYFVFLFVVWYLLYGEIGFD